MAGTILSLLMLAGMALTGGGIHAIVKRGDRKRGVLMILAGLVMFANVAISAIPGPDLPVLENSR
ncbi:hypothetical protein [Sphingobium estronivorans]|uniref:hypothetical protein n=1 Tax=Sphingobium estronivorans TaxID=1577690 RepID=UPI001238797F|nr:hypothetical protein [Sphingobium estronivorans]